MFKVEKGTNKITLELKTRIKDKRHLAEFNRLLSEDLVQAVQYAKTFNGTMIRIQEVRSARQKSYDKAKPDILSEKPTGSVLRLLNSQFDSEGSHKPLNLDHGNWIGVEIECFIPYSRAHALFEMVEIFPRDHIETTFCEPGEGCNECSVDGCEENHCEGHEDEDAAEPKAWIQALREYFKRLKLKRVSVKEDGSIRPESGSFGVEVTVLFRRDDKAPLRRLCQVLASLGAEVNKSCGMHVHLDQRGRSEAMVERRAKRLGLALPLLFSMVPASRRKNTYCKPGVSGFRGERYFAVNLTAFKKYQTIEVRLHSATRDFEKISNFVDLLTLIQKTPNATQYIRTIDDLCETANVPEALIEYVRTRVAMFSPEDVEESAGPQTQTASA